jgi:hypothetical protein
MKMNLLLSILLLGMGSVASAVSVIGTRLDDPKAVYLMSPNSPHMPTGRLTDSDVIHKPSIKQKATLAKESSSYDRAVIS